MKARTKIRTQITVGVVFGILATLATILNMADSTGRKIPYFGSESDFYLVGVCLFTGYVVVLFLKNKEAAKILFIAIALYWLIAGHLDILSLSLNPEFILGAQIPSLLVYLLEMALIGQGYLGLHNLEKLKKDPVVKEGSGNKDNKPKNEQKNKPKDE